jgi:hypothetical protein
MTPYETFRARELYLMNAIEHTISVIALARVSKSYKAEIAYELNLDSLNEELRALRAQQEIIDQTIH